MIVIAVAAAKLKGHCMTGLLRSAATAVVVRQGVNGLEVLLLQRNASSRFASSAWVFPGGGFEQQDQGVSEEWTAKQCAVRETQEECGLVLEAEKLHYFAHWTTPEGVPKRYATWFFIVQCEKGLIARADGEEMIDACWLSPAEALQQQGEGKMAMMPPTLICLELLQRFNDANTAYKCLAKIQVKCILPRVHQVDDGVCMLYPGDAGYESGEIAATGDRHRFWMIKSGWRYESSVDWFGLDYLL